MKHGSFLLYLASAGLLAQASTLVAELLPMRSERSAQHHQRGVEVAQSLLLQGKGTSTGGKWVYDSARGWWQRFCNVNFTGSVPKQEPVVPPPPLQPSSSRKPLEQIIDLVSLAYDGPTSGKSGDTHVVIRYKPDADVHPPKEVRGLAHPLDLAAGTPIGASRPNDNRTRRPPLPMPVQSSSQEILQLLRPGQHLWPGYEDIVLLAVSPDAENATFIRIDADAPAGTEPERIPLSKSTTRMSDEVQALLDARKAAPITGATDRDHPATAPSWLDVDETTRVGNTWHIGRHDAGDFGGDQSRLLDRIDIAPYQSPSGSSLRGVQVRTVDAQLGSSYGVTAGDIIRSVNDQPVRNKAELINVIRKQYDLGVRTFRTRWLTATGQEVERVYQAPPGKRGG
jgi:hypothetical protein